MIQLSALTAPSGITPVADVPLGQAGDSAEVADFGALLAAETAPKGEAAPAAITPPATLSAMPPLDGETLAQLPALAALPESGKILPPALAATGKIKPEAASNRVPLTMPQAKAAKPAEPDNQEPTLAQYPEGTAILPVLTLAPAPIVAPNSQADGDAPSPASARPSLPLAQATPPTLPSQAQSQAQTQVHAQPVEQLPVLALDRAVLPPTAAIAFEPATPATPGGASARIKLNPPASLASESESPDAAATLLGTPQMAGSTAPTANPSAAVQSANRPHDFAALVDSLVAAREAAQPQAVTIALAHAEFGQVKLHFSRDEAGLSVNMASADPDFARAASAAMPPPQASTFADSSAQQNGQPGTPAGTRHQGTAAQTGSGFAQGGNGSAQQHGERSSTRANPPLQRDRTAGSSTRDEIFA